VKSIRDLKSANLKIKGQNDANLLFFDTSGIIYYEFVPLKQTVNQAFYVRCWNVYGAKFVERPYLNR